MAAVVMTGTGIYSADGNANTQPIRVNTGTFLLGDSSTSLATGSGSVSRKLATFGFVEEILPTTGYIYVTEYQTSQGPGVTEDFTVDTGTPEIGNWNIFILGAYYLSTNVLSSFQCQRIRLNNDTTYNNTSAAVTYNIRTELKNESYSSDTTNFPTTKADIVATAGVGYALRLAARTSAAVGSRTVWRVYAENTFST